MSQKRSNKLLRYQVHLAESMLNLTSCLVQLRREDDIFQVLVQGGDYTHSLAEILRVNHARVWYCDSLTLREEERRSTVNPEIKFDLLAANGTLPKGTLAKSKILEDLVRSNENGSVQIHNDLFNNATGRGSYGQKSGAVFLHFKYQRGNVVITLSDPYKRREAFNEQVEGRSLNSLRQILSSYLEGVYDARTDLLTGLLNKRSYESEFIEQLVKRTSGYGGLIMIDIDHFKRYNDRLSHPDGDIALRKTGSHIQQSIRKNDIPGRYGGEEMIVLLPEITGITELAMVCERIRTSVESDNSYYGINIVGQVTVSVGGLLFPYGQEYLLEPLTKRVDVGLYLAKGERLAQVETARDSDVYQPLTGGRNRSVVIDFQSGNHYVVIPRSDNVIPSLNKLLMLDTF